jgi:glycosyltransferase involved in cell wall biosynthesis
MKLPVVLVLGPRREAVSGVSTHLNLLFASRLAEEFSLVHFQVGSEGRTESKIGRLARLVFSPLCLATAILSRGAAIVHLNTSLTAGAYWRDLAYLIVARGCGARVLYQVHGGVLPQQFFPGRALTAFLRWTLRIPDAIAVLAQAELEAYCRMVPAQQVLILPNAIDCAPYAGVSRPRSDPAQPLKLAYVGRLIRSKGLYEAVQAMSIAKTRGIKASLVIAGSGPDESALRDYVDKLGVASDVRFTGPIFGDRKIGMLAESDAFVFATCHPEGLPYALLEAMAAGLPVITTRVGAIPDVVADGVHGLFVPGSDPQAIYRAIAELSADRDLLARMSAACRTRVAVAYSMERRADELHRLYSAMSAAKPIKESTGSAPVSGRRPPCAE